MRVDDPALDVVYRTSAPEIVGIGVPLHVTLLYPWVAPGDVDTALPTLRSVLARHEEFAFTFTEVRTFDSGVVWLAPEPPERFATLTAAINGAFPDFPPYGGAHETVIPHCTLADVDEGRLRMVLAQVKPLVAPLLPRLHHVDHATVLAQRPDGYWREVARARLGS